MSYLRALPRESDCVSASEPPARSVAVVSPRVSDVVYVDDDATIETITAALQAWGLRVRAERENGHSGTKGLESEAAWMMTTRPDWPPLSRLVNIFSPVWLPTFEAEPVGAVEPEPQPAFSWFQQAA